jgi:tRNA A-37 threonylcarbamoyl transferase component Bud32
VDDTSKRSTVPVLPPQGAPAADEDWSGRTIGEFHILRSLGRGGMGQVFLAEQTSLQRKVAIKMLRPELAANKIALQRFQAEARAVGQLSHANIVQIYFVGEQDGVHFMALEYVEGRNLRDYLNRKGPPELAVAMSIMRQVASALQRAHEAGFVHRDVKPDNILLTRKGEAKVTDFGLSRCFDSSAQPQNLTQSGVAMGTPLYMSPEQVQGKNVDPRTDIYSFGATCFHLFAGQPPFRGASAFDIALKHVQDEPPQLAELRPDLPPDICAMVHQMMAKAPDERYQTFKDVLRDLNKVRDAIAGGNSLVPMVLPASSVMSGRSGRMSAGAHTTFDGGLGGGRGKWFPRLIGAAALLGLLAGGITVRLVRHRLNAGEPAPAPAGLAENPQPIISSDERFALEAAHQFADPSTADHRDLKKGLDFQIDLFVYYMKHHRLDDADAFARELLGHKYKPMPRDGEHPFKVFARFAQALVLAFRDQTQALDRLGNMIIYSPPKPAQAIAGNFQIGGVPGNMFDNPDLRRLLIEALNRLAADLKVDHFAKYPHLDELRKTWTAFRAFNKGKT